MWDVIAAHRDESIVTKVAAARSNMRMAAP
jgi:hypothetical protein